MELNTELHQLARCPLYKFQVDSLATTTEAGDFRHGHAENQLPPHYLSLTRRDGYINKKIYILRL